ncbi:protocatechuate 3,4-dioxygenase subunit alpha [Flavobacterium franklandianum]|uniref:Protocatechuate 3,4-dioxygenase subunit alpha n=1 Tax=Flavobacterium franklandianum TaxID=2594430 RepID=A0A553CLU4_9FLAO|nr:protocatechuate 3,4-dioxygenase subunit alpha [Flavobacterium franklandianum]TRX21365.1 protocatechuate 3,4-dioxygenase subunit alpha [Flavobacterium franklandianum]TRX29989.1 protocatechuate 3,4-dioxygenase subunit alpha [Flavobacterium franklandianum]
MNTTKTQTPSQTVGPYFGYGLTSEQYLYDFKSLITNKITILDSNSDYITIKGKIFDGENNPISDAMIELWQNDGHNRFFGRFGTGTDAENHFVFQTIKPKSVENQAPFVTLIVFMRGQLIHSYTRVYFSDEEVLNAQDTVLNAIPAERRNTIIAQKKAGCYEFNIYMQGENETVFFAV